MNTIANLAPVEARRSFNQWIDKIILARGALRRDCAAQIRAYVAAFAWLMDQIPYDIWNMANATR